MKSYVLVLAIVMALAMLYCATVHESKIWNEDMKTLIAPHPSLDVSGIFVRKRLQTDTDRYRQTSSETKSIQFKATDTRSDKGETKEDNDIRRKKNLFYESITNDERNIFQMLLTAFVKSVPANVTYFLYAGTLMGYYNHRGMIPWDDDIDILVKAADKPVLEEALLSLSPECELIKYERGFWKLHHRLSVATPYKWKWPFLDLFFYAENKSHIWNTIWPSGPKYPAKDVFPLRKDLFMGMTLPVPKNARLVLEEHYDYDIDICRIGRYDHKRESLKNRSEVVTLPCHYLWDKFEFVQR